jgi:hypothetical protein
MISEAKDIKGLIYAGSSMVFSLVLHLRQQVANGPLLPTPSPAERGHPFSVELIGDRLQGEPLGLHGTQALEYHIFRRGDGRRGTFDTFGMFSTFCLSRWRGGEMFRETF